ncbi:ArsB/NhaD family transporter [Gloeobacter kilaueensis]|uniref:Arsenical pump membrane protein n=1 Tax=Gloeobacter kilaueensis (strain ATCC BAA-2537 / CCAP 1431/1 / ULC 316 / JS1) TaxID=1183438 RepID=U5QNQ0_GLOK1|nr:ArsB/NhaD family transporter [Gloeobacter kilaueensis]AGY59224.1 arsenical pump membrane protein [Gloeobacter kilaueensis JS1]
MPHPLALLIFVAVLLLVLARPYRLPVAYPAVAGAALMLLLGAVQPADVLQVVRLSWDAVLTLIALVILSMALRANGFFRWAALQVVRRSGGNGRVLLVVLIALTALVAAILANDGAVLILTPLAWELMDELEVDPPGRFAYLFAVGFVCDAASTPLLVSNLTNILFADAFGLDFLSFARTMALPTLFALTSSAVTLLALFWSALPERYAAGTLAVPGAALRDRQAFITAWLGLAAMAVGYLSASVIHLPVSLAVMPVSTVLLVQAVQRKLLTPRQIFSEGPWGILFFAVGLFVVVVGLYRAGGLQPLVAALEQLSRSGQSFGVGGLVTGLSAIFNNLPAALVVLLGLKSAAAPPHELQRAVYASILGTNIGCKLTPIGSLSTLLWLELLRARGLVIRWGQYLRYAVPLTLIVLFSSLAGL